MRKNRVIEKYIAFYSILIMLSISFSSCLKEKDSDLPPLYGRNTPNVVAFQDNGGPSGGGAGYGATTTPFPLYQFSFTGTDFFGGTAGFDAIVIYGPGGPASQDITVNVSVSPQAYLDSFNNANNTDYQIPDASNYSFPSSVIIKKGQTQAYVHVSLLNSSAFDFSADYALPLTITSASSASVSSNFGTEINFFAVRNKYDGHYKVTGTMVDKANSALTGNYPMDVYLITAGANSVQLFDKAIGGVYHSILNNGGLSYYGAFGVQFNFDPSGDGTIISVVNVYGQPSSNGRSAEIDPSGLNKWNSSDGSMDVNYWMDQPTVITPHRTSFQEHYSYVGPR
ncbi:MAG TPA: DUF1735 domain-containing protein [Puia sp.]|nr:DUF1735 domain-containing protein [Puia sp.]